ELGEMQAHSAIRARRPYAAVGVGRFRLPNRAGPRGKRPRAGRATGRVGARAIRGAAVRVRPRRRSNDGRHDAARTHEAAGVSGLTTTVPESQLAQVVSVYEVQAGSSL